MTERDACALLKAQFEAAGFRIAENHAFDEDGVTFEIDGFDADARVGYEYITEEAGDSWDVDGEVIATLEARRKSGLFIFVVDEATAPDAAALTAAAAAFLRDVPKKEAKPPPAKPKRAAKSTTAPKQPKKRAPKATAAPKDKKPARAKRATRATS